MSYKRKALEPPALSATDEEFLYFLQRQLGSLSPWCQLNIEEQVHWQDLNVLAGDLQLLRRLFQEKPDFSLVEQARLEYLDAYLDLPVIEATLKPSYVALKRLLVAGVTYIPCKEIFYVVTKQNLCEKIGRAHV